MLQNINDFNHRVGSSNKNPMLQDKDIAFLTGSVALLLKFYLDIKVYILAFDFASIVAYLFKSGIVAFVGGALGVLGKDCVNLLKRYILNLILRHRQNKRRKEQIKKSRLNDTYD